MRRYGRRATRPARSCRSQRLPGSLTIRVPALFVFSDQDKVVRPDLTRAIAARWGAPHEIVAVEHSDDPYSHVISGDALSPSTTEALAERIAAWIGKAVR